MPLELQSVEGIEKGSLSVTEARKQYGIQSRSSIIQWLRKFINLRVKQTPCNMSKSAKKKRLQS
jgi:transposase